MVKADTETPSSGFEKLLSAAVASAAALQGKDRDNGKRWVRQKLAKAISRTEYTIAAYEQGAAMPPSLEILDILVRELTSLTYLSELWVRDIFTAYREPGWQPPQAFEPFVLQVRAQLPLPPYAFVGREKLIRQLATATKEQGLDLLLYGERGVGKTMVMLQLASMLKERHPEAGACDAIVWMDASDIPVPHLSTTTRAGIILRSCCCAGGTDAHRDRARLDLDAY